MAAKRPSLPSAGEIAHYSGPLHPVVSAVQFSELTRNTQGATMNAHTGAIAEVGKTAAYAVGGAADQSKRGAPRVRTKRLPLMRDSSGAKVADMSLATVLNERNRIRATGMTDPGRSLGSWDARASDKPRQNVDIDASDLVSDKQKAVALGKARGEDAIFDLKKAKNISTM